MRGSTWFPKKDLAQHIQYYKGELTENALLTKGATLAAKKNTSCWRIPLNPLPSATLKPNPLSTQLTKILRQLPSGVGVGAAAGAALRGGHQDEEGNLITGPVKQWLRRMIKGRSSTPKPQTTPSVKNGKVSISDKDSPGKASISTPKTSISSSSDLTARLQSIRERRKTLEEKLAASSQGKGPPKSGTVETFPWWEDCPKEKIPTSARLRQQLVSSQP